MQTPDGVASHIDAIDVSALLKQLPPELTPPIDQSLANIATSLDDVHIYAAEHAPDWAHVVGTATNDAHTSGGAMLAADWSGRIAQHHDDWLL